MNCVHCCCKRLRLHLYASTLRLIIPSPATARVLVLSTVPRTVVEQDCLVKVWRFTCRVKPFEVSPTANPAGLFRCANTLRAILLQSQIALRAFRPLHSPKCVVLSLFSFTPDASLRFYTKVSRFRAYDLLRAMEMLYQLSYN